MGSGIVELVAKGRYNVVVEEISDEFLREGWNEFNLPWRVRWTRASCRPPTGTRRGGGFAAPLKCRDLRDCDLVISRPRSRTCI